MTEQLSQVVAGEHIKSSHITFGKPFAKPIITLNHRSNMVNRLEENVLREIAFHYDLVLFDDVINHNIFCDITGKCLCYVSLERVSFPIALFLFLAC